MATPDAVDWNPVQPAWKSPYATDFGSTPDGWARAQLRNRGKNWDFVFGDMDDDSQHLALIGRGGRTGSRSIGSGGDWLGSGSVNIPGAGAFDSGGRQANIRTLNNVVGSIPRAIKRGVKAFNTLAGAGQANKLSELYDKRADLMDTIAANQQQTQSVQNQYKNTYMGGSWDPYSQAYAKAAGSSTNTYDKTRPRLDPNAGASNAGTKPGGTTTKRSGTANTKPAATTTKRAGTKNTKPTGTTTKRAGTKNTASTAQPTNKPKAPKAPKTPK
jgi:hypothetical protein